VNEEDMDRNDEWMAVEDEETNKDASDRDEDDDTEEDEDDDTGEDEDDDTEEDERDEGYAESSDVDGVDDHGSQDPEEKYLSARGNGEHTGKEKKWRSGTGHSEDENEDAEEFDVQGEDHEDTDRLVFRLSVYFAAEEFTNGQPDSSFLVYFSGILGFSDDWTTFRRAHDFTPFCPH
jgi:hypothetical protein